MTDSEDAEAAALEFRLGVLDAAELGQRDELAVRYPRRQAGIRRPVPDREAKRPRQRAGIRLGHAVLQQRAVDASLAHGPQTGAVGARIRSVRAVADRGKAPGSRQFQHPVHAHSLTHVATVARVGPELRLVELAVRDDLVADADLGRQPAGMVQLDAGESFGRRRHRQRPVAQRAPRQGGHQPRVDAARKGDQHRAAAPEVILDYPLQHLSRRLRPVRTFAAGRQCPATERAPRTGPRTPRR